MKASIMLWVALGGALGAVCRYAVALSWVAHWPFATLLVNVLGSVLLGYLAGAEASGTALAPSLKALFGIGFCGAFTTFSTFSVQTMALLQEGRLAAAAANIIVSVATCLGGAFLGFSLARA